MTSPTPGPSFEWVNTVTPVDGVATLDLSRSSHFHINGPDDDFEVVVDNVPAGPYAVDLYLRLTFDGMVPAITWPAEFAAHTTEFEPFTSTTLHMLTWNDGVEWTAARSSSTAGSFSTLVGDGAATTINVTHGLAADCIVWQLRDASTGEKVEAAEYHLSPNATQLVFDDPPETDGIHFSAIGFPA